MRRAETGKLCNCSFCGSLSNTVQIFLTRTVKMTMQTIQGATVKPINIVDSIKQKALKI